MFTPLADAFRRELKLTMISFMEGARIRSSVALPREVAKPTVIEDNGEKVMLKTGQQIYCNLVCPAFADCKILRLTMRHHRSPQAMIPRHGLSPRRFVLIAT